VLWDYRLMLGTSADHASFPPSSDRFFKLLGEPCDETPTYKGLNEKTLDKKWLIEQIKMGHDIVPQFQYNWPEVNESAE
jgi:hypothetical protein